MKHQRGCAVASGIGFGTINVIVGLLTSLGGYRAAITLSRLAHRLSGGPRGDYLAQLGFIHERAGDLESAARCYEERKILEPSDASVFFDLGVVYERQGKRALAIEHYERAMTLGRDFGDDFIAELRARVTALRSS